jgi:MFS family permease
MVTEVEVPKAYRRLLTQPGVPSLLGMAVIVRLGPPVLGLALVLATVTQLGSYAGAGLVLTAHALALAASTPLGGRLTDRFGTRPVLGGYLIAHSAAYGLLLLAQHSPAPVVTGAAALLGASSPPAGAVIRGAWPRVVPADSLPAAYAMDNSINELAFIAGPLLVPVLMLVMPAYGVVATAGAAVLAATALLLSRTAQQAAPPPAVEPGSWLSRLAGPLADRNTVALLVLAGFGALGFGCLRIGSVASASASGRPALAGVLMGLLSAGALAGTLGYGARVWPVAGRRLLVTLSAAEAFCLLAGAFTAGFVVLAVLITAFGLLSGPRDAAVPTLLAETASVRHRVEVFAWLNTFMWTGYGLGTAVAGRLTGPHNDGSAAFAAAAIVALAAAILATRVNHAPQR